MDEDATRSMGQKGRLSIEVAWPDGMERRNKNILISVEPEKEAEFIFCVLICFL